MTPGLPGNETNIHVFTRKRPIALQARLDRPPRGGYPT